MSLELFLKDTETIKRLREGLFGKYIDSYAHQLRDRGYNTDVALLHLRLIGEFVRWIKVRRVAKERISFEHAKRFAQYRRRRRQPTGCDVSAVVEFIKLLQQRKVLPESPSVQEQSVLELVTDEFVRYLIKERGLAAATIKYYREFVREFLLDRFGTAGGVDCRLLKPADILRFVQLSACRDSGKRVKLLITALRSFFRYLRYKGIIDSNLASTVPSVVQRANSSLPKAISPSQIEQVISSCKGSTSIGRRDHAMFLLLARLGLRAGEVVSLRLDDIDWRDGSISIRGKGGQVTKMPLPIDAGEAIAMYLLEDRPPSKLRFIFLRAKAPVSYLTVSGLSTRVRLALDAHGIETPNCSTHLFRHSLATNMLRDGASLTEIGELLRHRSTQTTEIYAKVDLASLRQLALSWPGGEQ